MSSSILFTHCARVSYLSRIHSPNVWWCCCWSPNERIVTFPSSAGKREILKPIPFKNLLGSGKRATEIVLEILIWKKSCTVLWGHFALKTRVAKSLVFVSFWFSFRCLDPLWWGLVSCPHLKSLWFHLCQGFKEQKVLHMYVCAIWRRCKSRRKITMVLHTMVLHVSVSVCRFGKKKRAGDAKTTMVLHASCVAVWNNHGFTRHVNVCGLKQPCFYSCLAWRRWRADRRTTTPSGWPTGWSSAPSPSSSSSPTFSSSGSRSMTSWR